MVHALAEKDPRPGLISVQNKTRPFEMAVDKTIRSEDAPRNVNTPPYASNGWIESKTQLLISAPTIRFSLKDINACTGSLTQ